MEDLRVYNDKNPMPSNAARRRSGAEIFGFNPDYALGFVMRSEIARKSGCLETEA